MPQISRGTFEFHPFGVLAILVGAQSLGGLGVLLALPIAAPAPVIERLWGGGHRSGAAASLWVADAGAPVPPE